MARQIRHLSPLLAWQATAPFLVALLLLFLIGFGIYSNRQLDQLRRSQAALAAQVAEQTEVMVLLGAGNTQRVELPLLGEADPEMLAVVLFDPERPEAFFYVDGFPSLPPATVYQLWLVQGESQVSGGLFEVDEEGSGVLFLHAPEPLRAFDAMAITVEPAGGSPAPTTPPLAAGDLPAVEAE